jgi:hypothetical protein
MPILVTLGIAGGGFGGKATYDHYQAPQVSVEQSMEQVSPPLEIVSPPQEGEITNPESNVLSDLEEWLSRADTALKYAGVGGLGELVRWVKRKLSEQPSGSNASMNLDPKEQALIKCLQELKQMDTSAASAAAREVKKKQCDELLAMVSG